MDWEILEKIITYLSGLLTPLIAVVAIYIAYQQWNTNRIRLKHELFDRRYDVYRKIQYFLSQILQTAEVTIEDYQKFLREIDVSCFLFGNDISGYISEIRSTLKDYYVVGAELKGSLESSEKMQRLKDENALFKDIEKLFQKSEEKFSKYLKIKN